MSEPTTSNVGLIIPGTGSLPGAWGSDAINPNFASIDGIIAGVATVPLSNANVTLTAPPATIVPSAGPYQSQNAVINLTGALSANVQVTLPLPGKQTIANFTTGNFVVTLKAAGTGGQVVGIPQGIVTEVFNDGTNVKFCSLGGYPGKMEFMAGVSALPAWVAACTIRPYLIADATVYNASEYPALYNIYKGQFGGNGISTFATPDLSGRVPLQYDFTGARITTAGCGIDGRTIGAAADNQSITLTTSQIPSHTHAASVSDPGHTHFGSLGPNATGANTTVATGASFAVTQTQTITPASTGISVSNSNTGGGGAHPNVQPSQVVGIWLIKT